MERERVDAVQRMQDYIEEHLMDGITLKQLASAAGYSPWYAARMFRELTGEAAFNYIRKRRLSVAAYRLRDGRERVLDVALEFQFDSHEGFTRAFHRTFGLSPARYRREAPPIQLYLAYSARAQYRMKHPEEKEECQVATGFFAQVTDFPGRKLLLKRGVEAEGYFEYCEEVGCDVWGVLCSVKEALNEPMGLWLPDSMRPEGTSRYVQGVEVPADYAGAIPEGYELMELPSCQMIVFQGEPYDDEHFDSAIEEVWKSIERYDPERFGYRWATDELPRFQLEPQGWRGYIEGRPVKPL